MPSRTQNFESIEFIYVDDGSADGSYNKILQIVQADPRARAIKLSRNFGSNGAILAGLAHATGECAAMITADLQDPPELVAQMLSKRRDGADVVLAVRTSRGRPRPVTLVLVALLSTVPALCAQFDAVRGI